MTGDDPRDRRDEGALRALVHGHVQGVGFRWATRRRAVLVTARGPVDTVAELLAWLRGGSTPGHVTRVDVDEV